MIVRVLGEGQLRIDDAAMDDIEAADARLLEAVEADDETRFRAALAELFRLVDAASQPLPVDYFATSDLVLPDRDATLAEVHAFLSSEPGD